MGRACPKHFGCPFRAGQIRREESLQFLLDVVLDPPDGRLTSFEKQIGRAGITVVGKSNTSCVDEEIWVSGDVANGRTMSVPEDDDWPVE